MFCAIRNPTCTIMPKSSIILNKKISKYLEQYGFFYHTSMLLIMQEGGVPFVLALQYYAMTTRVSNVL